MAGDWIKVEHATLDKPEIAMAAEVLGISEADSFYLFMRYWVWLDQNLDEARVGLVPFVSRRSLETKFKCPGFAGMLESLGWAQFDDEQRILTVVNWDRHNGKSAQSRAVEQRKKKRQRANCPDVVPMVAGPEKRREEKSIKDQKQKLEVRATRLPADWQLSEEQKNWAVLVHKWDPQHTVRESLKFRDHFHSVPGSKGLKNDWNAAWRNWVRRSSEYA